MQFGFWNAGAKHAIAIFLVLVRWYVGSLRRRSSILRLRRRSSVLALGRWRSILALGRRSIRGWRWRSLPCRHGSTTGWTKLHSSGHLILTTRTDHSFDLLKIAP